MSHFSKILVLAAFCATPILADPIGTVASVEPSVSGRLAGTARQVLRIGTPLMRDQVITSNANGRAQLLFLDQSTLSVAPNSQITLDEFVYGPADGQTAGQTDMALSLTKGALRFIGGKTAEQNPATIATPTATIGVRGSSVLVSVAQGQTTAVFIAGERLCLTADGQQHCTNRRGGVLTDAGYQGRVNPDYLARLLTHIDGPPRKPTDQDFDKTGITDSAPRDRQPVSTTGEEPDQNPKDDDFIGRTLTGIEPPVPGGGGGVSPDPVIPDPQPSPCDDPTFVNDVFEGDYDLCVLELG